MALAMSIPIRYCILLNPIMVTLLTDGCAASSPCSLVLRASKTSYQECAHWRSPILPSVGVARTTFWQCQLWRSSRLQLPPICLWVWNKEIPSTVKCRLRSRIILEASCRCRSIFPEQSTTNHGWLAKPCSASWTPSSNEDSRWATNKFLQFLVDTSKKLVYYKHPLQLDYDNLCWENA